VNSHVLERHQRLPAIEQKLDTDSHSQEVLLNSNWSPSEHLGGLVIEIAPGIRLADAVSHAQIFGRIGSARFEDDR
jgi:hypothetical protein